MGKVKSWLWDQAEDKLDSITIKIENGEIDHDTAYKMIDDDTSTAWNILGFDTIDDVKDYLSEIVVKSEQQAELVDF
jgi:hypothetical protein